MLHPRTPPRTLFVLNMHGRTWMFIDAKRYGILDAHAGRLRSRRDTLIGETCHWRTGWPGFYLALVVDPDDSSCEATVWRFWLRTASVP